MPNMIAQSTIIEDIEQLRDYLKIAMKLEHATIPPYLTAAYSANIDYNKGAMDILREVAKEEMLHLALVGNLLNAVGGKPGLLSDDFIPKYPTHLPTGEDTFEVNIEKLSRSAIQTFLKIERPAPIGPEHIDIVEYITNNISVAQEDLHSAIKESKNPFVKFEKKEDGTFLLNYKVAMIPHNKLSFKRQQPSTRSFLPSAQMTDLNGEKVELHFWSIGEFYQAISLGFVHLNNHMRLEELFCGNPKNQVTDIYYSGGGKLTKVTDLKSALFAIEMIAGQGEGGQNKVYDENNEIAHYYRFDQIMKGSYYRVPDKNGENGDDPGKPQGGIFSVHWDKVFPIKSNSKIIEYENDKELEKRALLFNCQYKSFLQLLNDGFNGKPEVLDIRKGEFSAKMYDIMKAMERLIKYPMLGTGENAAPTFEMDSFPLFNNLETYNYDNSH